MNYRMFQRYSLKGIQHQIASSEENDLQAFNVSLSGIGLFGPVGFAPEKVTKIIFVIADKKFTLYLNLVWAEKVYVSSGMKISAGYRIVLNEEKQFKSWLTFIKALDKIFWKKNGQKRISKRPISNEASS